VSDGDLTVSVAGVRITLLREGAAYLDAADELLIGDLHLGRARTLQRAGVGLPSGADDDDVARAEALVHRTAARRIVLLGDLIHARAGVDRTVLTALARLADLAPGEVRVVPGNHDGAYLPELAPTAGLIVTGARLRLAGVDLTHHPRTGPAPAGAPLRIAAHLHPSVELRDGATRLRLPAFLVRARELILPAFGSSAAGAPLRPGGGERLFAATGTRVVQVGRGRESTR
jgi:DNA ligase-associated metallophosphoesterase